ncbi:low molecular weight protein arginine phosphatase [Clostridium botulinum]|uniref:Protein tyrosine phosphatase n=1 Tax=Clostridium botulinum C/D str. DC5 TaxID=1443128 RepID=A0A0A0IEK9_CLOBO|nr:low molecular weight protein arginine phosphatase [Clostridium botulinum]KEI00315.1 protein tyrosine phosphatase [Clostridium botulinum C/D str. BKT75002]KEI08936.1 protein tyrosine phosphatase [Clostridium botulinum C/D str. BKT2873]KGM93848.1 protein tyrosine phosphatase [Clostridium botulinum D str. CCUG 7971]KGM99407.1 protein tyrosine phosphatase [Clostridium botulinum C/D str. DC5]KOC51189.1 protein tyrosine phosphatase [Clostridium botulinum]
MEILFVCTGNTCRSCMAEVIFNEMSDIENIKAYSAGISIVSGSKTSKNAVQLVKDNFNLDISNRFAQQLLPGDIKKSNLILTMTEYMAEVLKDTFPKEKQKIFSLNSFVNISKDVSDPFGGNVEMYQRTFYSLKKSIELLISKLKEDSGK